MKIRQNSLFRNSSSSKRNDTSSGHGSCPTLQNDPYAEFQKMKEALHNLFQFAKKEITLLYQTTIYQVSLMGSKLKNGKNISQQFLQQLGQIRRQAELAMQFVPQKMQQLLMVSEILKKTLLIQNPQYDNYGYVKPNPIKRVRTSNSLNKEQNSTNSFDASCRNLVKIISSSNSRKIEDLKFLEGNWPNLQSLQLEKKGLQGLCVFQQVSANFLQKINLSGNAISDLSPFKGANLPFLFELNLSKNKIKKLDGIQEANFPKLTILNLCKNSIVKLQTLADCEFPGLLELHLEGNRIQNLEPLNHCNFINLEILNVDNNQVQFASSLEDIKFYKLKVLSFSHNEIYSIEFVSRMSLRKLQGFIGHNNKIKSLQPLTTASFPMLKQIILHNNQIMDLSCVKKMKFPELSGFDLENNKIGPQTVGCFTTNDKGFHEAKKKFPFIII